MRIIIIKIMAIISVLLFLAEQIECQVTLNRKLLEEWFPRNLNEQTKLALSQRNISAIDPLTFTGLTNLTDIELDETISSQSIRKHSEV